MTLMLLGQLADQRPAVPLYWFALSLPDTLSPQAAASGALAVVALGMLVVVTGGIVYLTAVEWRDRRRRDRDRRSG